MGEVASMFTEKILSTTAPTAGSFRRNRESSLRFQCRRMTSLWRLQIQLRPLTVLAPFMKLWVALVLVAMPSLSSAPIGGITGNSEVYERPPRAGGKTEDAKIPHSGIRAIERRNEGVVAADPRVPLPGTGASWNLSVS